MECGAQIIHKGKVVAETTYPREDSYALARWAHCIGWNVDSYDDKGGKLSSDCGKHKATLRIYTCDRLHPVGHSLECPAICNPA